MCRGQNMLPIVQFLWVMPMWGSLVRRSRFLGNARDDWSFSLLSHIHYNYLCPVRLVCCKPFENSSSNPTSIQIFAEGVDGTLYEKFYWNLVSRHHVCIYCLDVFATLQQWLQVEFRNLVPSEIRAEHCRWNYGANIVALFENKGYVLIFYTWRMLGKSVDSYLRHACCLFEDSMTLALSQRLGRCPSFRNVLYNHVSVGESSIGSIPLELCSG